MKKKTKMKKSSAVTDRSIVHRMVDRPPSKSDPNGSYTGKPMDQKERPVQDADDL